MSPSSSTSSGQRLLDESGLALSHEPIDEALVSTVLERDYHVGGRLERLATEKDDTFRVRTGSGDYLVKVAPASEPEMVVHLQTAALRFLEKAAPELPVQRVKLTVDGGDHVVVTTSHVGPRILRVLDFVDGAVWSRTASASANCCRRLERPRSRRRAPTFPSTVKSFNFSSRRSLPARILSN